MPATARRRLDPAARQAEIVTVATRHFAERGYEATSTAEIATDAGVTRALVHHYFGDKPGLFRAVVQLSADAASTIPHASRTLPLPDRIATNLDHWLDFLDRHRGTWLATAGHGDNIADPDIRAVVEQSRDNSINYMVTSYPERLTGADHEIVALRSYLGFNQAACRQWLTGQATRHQTHHLLTNTLLHLLESTIPALRPISAEHESPSERRDATHRSLGARQPDVRRE